MFVEMEAAECRDYDIFDGCYGVVECCCRKGAFLSLDNGEPAFAYNFCNLRPGTEVLCTVRKLAREGFRKLVTIDSVCRYPAAA